MLREKEDDRKVEKTKQTNATIMISVDDICKGDSFSTEVIITREIV